MAAKAVRGNQRVGRATNNLKSTTCKTCSHCRQKKIKCSGVRPHCDECTANSLVCDYPRDARREPRPSRALFQNLEATMAAMLEHMRSTGTIAPEIESTLRSARMMLDQEASDGHEPAHDQANEDQLHATTPESSVYVPMPTPAPSIATSTDASRGQGDSPWSMTQNVSLDTALQSTTRPDPRNDASSHEFQHRSSFAYASQPLPLEQQQRATENTNKNQDGGLSLCEARVAGVFHEHGRVTSVHGLAGIMNPTRRALHKENISKVLRKGEAAVSSSRARLISNAILQKQRENRLFRQPQQSIDLDSCEPDLARHLITLHFNRQHCSHSMTYRPAILDSIATGGPWVNKLLLNAIYYNSSLYSDRECLRSSSQDPSSVGKRFYDRFCMLFIEAIGKPSVPSAVALLLVSVTLVAQGKVSEGWALSGTAYRMIIDLGCHMMLGPDYEDFRSDGGAQLLQKDIDHEMRKRLYWGAYMTDVCQSLYLGRECSFATTEARVPLQLLDTFEELEDWEPYKDPSDKSHPPTYQPQTVHAVSSFTACATLMQIGALISSLYGIGTVSCTTDVVLKKRSTIESKLENWLSTLPNHFSFDPDGHQIPPPHQITLHTTYHTLRILLYRAFLEEGHLRRHSDAEVKRSCEQECIKSALVIEKHVRAYRRTFTLRRAPLLLSYAIYSAVAIVLPQERHDRGHFTDLIAFFWTCLGELQHGCNTGLKKPLYVLQDMAREFELSAKERGNTGTSEFDLGGLDQSFFPQLMAPSMTGNMYPPAHYFDHVAAQNAMDQHGMANEAMEPGMTNFLNDQEWNLSQNTLYGLFAPTQSFQ